MLRSVELRRRKKKMSKRDTHLKAVQVKSILSKELNSVLGEYLAENDSVMIEVQNRYNADFISLLASAEFLTCYEFEHVQDNKFIFRNKIL